MPYLCIQGGIIMRAIIWLPRIKVENLWVLLLAKVQLIPIVFLLLIINLWNAYTWKCDQLKGVTEQLEANQALTAQVFGEAQAPAFHAVKVTLSSYNPVRSQGWGSGLITYSGKLATPGMVAVSRDIQRKYRIKMGSKLMIPGYGVFTVMDLMHPRKKLQIDIVSLNPAWSRNFGIKRGTVYIPYKV